MNPKRVVRWRYVSCGHHWTCWEIDGQRIIVNDPKHLRKGKKAADLLDDRVLRILATGEGCRRERQKNERE